MVWQRFDVMIASFQQCYRTNDDLIQSHPCVDLDEVVIVVLFATYTIVVLPTHTLQTQRITITNGILYVSLPLSNDKQQLPC